MSKQFFMPAALSLLALACLTSRSAAQTREDGTVRMATSVMNEIMAIPAQQIPQSLLGSAQGVAIIPGVVKVSLIGGLRHGKGVLMVRDEAGRWAAPQFVSLTGGSVGWQVGVQSTDVILVFKTRKSVDKISRGKFTIGVDAAAAAGPVGRQAAAATDAQLRAEILSYSRSRGLFAGVSLDGSALQIDGMANTAFYYPAGYTPYAAATGQGAVVPASAMQLVSTISRYTNAQVPAPEITTATPPAAGNPPGAAPPLAAAPAPATATVDYVRHQLINSAANLNLLLDENWKQFLALPGEIVTNTGTPSAEQMDAVLANYDQVARNAQFRTLASRPEFQATHELLQKYAASLSQQAPGALALPPPPSASGVNTRARY